MYDEYYETYQPYSTNSYIDNQYSNSYDYIDNNNDRNFIVPFVLGGITGGLLAPAFYRPYPNYYRPYPYYYAPYPYYGPYYRK